MSYSKDEQETVILYDVIENIWKVESSYGPHITKMLKIANCEVITEHESGKPSMVKARLENPQVLMRNIPQKREMTDEERRQLGERLKLSRQN